MESPWEHPVRIKKPECFRDPTVAAVLPDNLSSTHTFTCGENSMLTFLIFRLDGIGHQLGPMGVGHGETSCILLPAVCKYNKSVNAKQQQKVKDVLCSELEVLEVVKNAGWNEEADLGDMLDAIFRLLGMPRSLKDFDIGEDKLGPLAENSLHDRWLPTNPRPITEKAQVLEILDMVKG